MADIKLYLPKVLKLEGGYEQQKTDVGNYDSAKRLIGTNHGVGALTLETYYGKFKGIQFAQIELSKAVDIMKGLTIAEAMDICKRLFWDVCSADLIVNQSVAELIVDWFWGSGYYGLQWEQGCMKVYGLNITPDNTITADEAQYINSCLQQKLFDYLKDERMKFIFSIIEKTPTFEVYRKGWVNRINSFIFVA